jgi:hypothetical protein
MSRGPDDPDIILFPGLGDDGQEVDPDTFLPLVHSTMRDRPLDRVVVLALDKQGHFTIHSSIADIEFTRSMITMAEGDTYTALVQELAWADAFTDEDWEFDPSA